MSQPPGGYPPGGPPGGAPPGTGATQPQAGGYPQQQYPQAQPQQQYPQAQPQQQYPQAQPQQQYPDQQYAPQGTAQSPFPTSSPTEAEPEVEPMSPVAAQRRKARSVALLGLMSFAFGAVCMLTSLYFTSDGGKAVRGSFGPQGGTVGPIQTTQDNQVLEVDFRQRINGYGWAYISGEIEDAEQEALFGFGGEAWHEQGNDDGHWDEREENFDIKVTVPAKGTYYAAFEVEQQPGQPVGGQMDVVITPKAGSAVPHFAAGLIGLVLGALLVVAGIMMAPVQVKIED